MMENVGDRLHSGAKYKKKKDYQECHEYMYRCVREGHALIQSNEHVVWTSITSNSHLGTC